MSYITKVIKIDNVLKEKKYFIPEKNKKAER